MNLNKMCKVVYYLGFAGLTVAAFAWGFNLDVIRNLD